MRFEFMYTAEDLRELDLITKRFSSPHGRFAWRRWLGFLASFAFLLFVLIQEWLYPTSANRSSNASTNHVSPAFAVIFWPLMLVLMISFVVWSHGRRYIRQLRENPLLQVIKVTEFTDAGVSVFQPSTSTTWNWDAFSELVESQRAFALRIKGKKGEFLLIPKRVIPENEQEAFQSLVRSKTQAEVRAFPVLRAGVDA